MKRVIKSEEISKLTFFSITLNLILFIIKILLATMINSVAMLSDAFNHFSDSLSGFIFWIGQILSGRKADANHPYGHGRGEYLTSLSIAVLMLVVSAQFFIESIRRLMLPFEVVETSLAVIILLLGILIKFILFLYSNRLFKKTNLLSTKALAIDNLFDVYISSIVLISLLLQPFFNFSIDSLAGLFVAVMMAWSAWQILLKSVRRVLGESLPSNQIEEIRTFLKQYPEVLGSHSFMFHDYGPHFQTLSFHLEVPANETFIRMHDLSDTIEDNIKTKFGYEVTIHLDPMMINKEDIQKITEPIWQALHERKLKEFVKDIRVIKEKLHQEMIVLLNSPKDQDKVKSYLEKQFSQYRFVMDW